MKFSGIERFSLLDYDSKVSLVVFTSGCNFACEFCHNSSLINSDEGTITEESVLSYLENKKKLIDAVVITGGEPTLHAGLYDFINKVKQLGFLVKLDSNGTHPEVIKKLLDDHLLDYIAMDIKSSISNYSLIANRKVDIEKIKQSIEIIKSSNIDYEFRTTLINEYHSFDEIIGIRNLLGRDTKLVLQKYISSDSCVNKNLHHVEINDVKKYQEYFIDQGIDCKIRGY